MTHPLKRIPQSDTHSAHPLSPIESSRPPAGADDYGADAGSIGGVQEGDRSIVAGPVAPAAAAGPTTGNGDVVVERACIAGVPVLMLRSRGGGAGPVVLLSHGFRDDKETVVADVGAEELARRGHVVVALDNRGHGERRAPTPVSPGRGPGDPVSLLAIRTLIKETADDIPALLDGLAREHGLDVRRVAMTGISMGGFVTWRAMTVDPRIDVAVPILASAYWEDIPGQVPFPLSGVGEAQAYAAQYNPALQRKRLGHQAILALLGAEDPHLDVAKAAAFVESLRPAYSQSPDRIAAKVYPHIGHQFTEAMRTDLFDWLHRHRFPAPAAAAIATAPTAVARAASSSVVTRTGSFVVPGSPAQVFPLLCPKREEEWIPGWKAETVYAPSGASGEDAVFRTRLAEGTPLLWVVSRYEPPTWIEFSCVAPDAVVTRLKLHVEAVGSGTRVDFTRTYVSIGDKGPAIVLAVTEEAFMNRLDELRAHLASYLSRAP